LDVEPEHELVPLFHDARVSDLRPSGIDALGNHRTVALPRPVHLRKETRTAEENGRQHRERHAAGEATVTWEPPALGGPTGPASPRGRSTWFGAVDTSFPIGTGSGNLPQNLEPRERPGISPGFRGRFRTPRPIGDVRFQGLESAKGAMRD